MPFLLYYLPDSVLAYFPNFLKNDFILNILSETFGIGAGALFTFQIIEKINKNEKEQKWSLRKKANYKTILIFLENIIINFLDETIILIANKNLFGKDIDLKTLQEKRNNLIKLIEQKDQVSSEEKEEIFKLFWEPIFNNEWGFVFIPSIFFNTNDKTIIYGEEETNTFYYFNKNSFEKLINMINQTFEFEENQEIINNFSQYLDFYSHYIRKLNTGNHEPRILEMEDSKNTIKNLISICIDIRNNLLVAKNTPAITLPV